MSSGQHGKLLDEYDDLVKWTSHADAEVCYETLSLYSTKELKTLEHQLTLRFGQNLCVVGLSGQGKTTLCHELSKKLPDTFSAVWHGKDELLEQGKNPFQQLTTVQALKMVKELNTKFERMYGHDVNNLLIKELHMTPNDDGSNISLKSCMYCLSTAIEIAEGKITADEVNKNDKNEAEKKWQQGLEKDWQRHLEYVKKYSDSITESSRSMTKEEHLKDYKNRVSILYNFEWMRKYLTPPNYGFPQEPIAIVAWLQNKIAAATPRLSPELAIAQMFAKRKNILLDTEAYSATRLAKLDRHITELQSLWRDVSKIAEIPPNWVIFMQKELYNKYEHFFVKKFQKIEMERVQAKDFVDHVNSIVKHPFDDKALFELAVLSQGIWRRFKWYISDCLMKATEENLQHITEENVKSWIGLDRAIEDMKLELSSVFRESGLRHEEAAKILIFLSRGKKLQSEIRDHVGVSAMECSRILKTLKKENYVESERRGLFKVWKINVGGE